ncbi:nucleoside triphosphate hydrolase [Defluviimonas sp. WL0075]|uniref:Nucleoside triphosphate hydrolase n=1 Tax=Albidovulum sediminicola TaxID=2984331 RepID=A0ABT2Z481_9RHOB|nr:nucleoside triphosphate hydrolase [Defluviimonas sp. WL0075]MCV2865907.1 nucleoside triphosphate hydrolase [Defluviimonas sp. WL0075]
MIDTDKEIGRTAAGLADRVLALPRKDARLMVAVAGPPGSGKSTLAEQVVAGLVARGAAAVLMPMDGFHLDNRLLEPRGLLPRKGAPETFDFHGFAHALNRVRNEPSVILPVFDRDREIAIAGAAEIRPETRIVVAEGNYLLLDEDPWRALAPLWDLSVFLSVPVEELERRLVGRWLAHGFAPEAARAKALGNDLPNAERVMRAARRADIVINWPG